MRAAILLFASLGFASGCGRSTSGQEGKTTWRMVDGLCDGGIVGDECEMSVPLAVGATPGVSVKGDANVSLAGAEFVGEGSVGVTSFDIDTSDPSIHRASLDVVANAAGPGSLVVIDSDGEELDRVDVSVAEVDALECGKFDLDDVKTWKFPSLEVAGTVTILASANNDNRKLACRAVDAGGTPLLTVKAIAWEVLSPTGGVELHDDAPFGASPAHGATVVVDAPAPAQNIGVVATAGAATGTITLTIQ